MKDERGDLSLYFLVIATFSYIMTDIVEVEGSMTI